MSTLEEHSKRGAGALAVGALLWACSPTVLTSSQPETDGGGTGGAASGSGGSGSLFHPADAASPLTATIVGALRVCRGDCTTLAVVTEGGAGALAYDWGGVLPPTAGPHAVCPDRTREYRVTVTASESSGVEFGSADTATATATVEVLAECPGEDPTLPVDGGAPSVRDGGSPVTDGADAKPDAEPPVGAQTLCERRFTLGPDANGTTRIAGSLWGAVEPLATDAGGNILVAGDFHGVLDLGGGALLSDGSESTGFVAKFDASCHHLWSRQLGDARTLVSGGPVGADADGNVYVAGAFVGSLDLGSGPVTSSQSAIYVARFSPDGAPLWGKAFPSASTRTSQAHTLAVDGAGNVYVSGKAGWDTNFGLGSLSVGVAPELGFVVKLDAAGRTTLSLPVPGGDPYPTVDALPSGAFAVTTVSRGAPDWEGFGEDPGERYARFVTHFEASGLGVSTAELGPVNEQDPMIWAHGAAYDASGHLFIDEGRNGSSGESGEIVRSKAVTKVWSRSTTLWSFPIQGAVNEWWGGVAADGAGNVVNVGQFVDTLALGDAVLHGDAAGDVYVMKRTGENEPVWALALGGPSLDQPLGVATDPSGNVIVGGVTLLDTGVGELWFVKLAP